MTVQHRLTGIRLVCDRPNATVSVEFYYLTGRGAVNLPAVARILQYRPISIEVDHDRRATVNNLNAFEYPENLIMQTVKFFDSLHYFVYASHPIDDGVGWINHVSDCAEFG